MASDKSPDRWALALLAPSQVEILCLSMVSPELPQLKRQKGAPIPQFMAKIFR